ncbi:MAG TPA: phosphatidylglycerophosphatase A [Gammaproteobacteria bacterium]|nr:phosphatidylglycerophosphatase A [Gammaproteobacteria bacterium]
MSGPLTAREVFRNPVHFLAYGFGAGLSPKAPGTAGTLVAIPVYLLVHTGGLWFYLGFTLAALLAGIALCGYSARRMGVADPSGVVWDEIVGYLVSMAAAPFGWIWIIAGFALFRLFDIWKPWPIRVLDRRVKGGFGIMLDDVVAGLFTTILLGLAAQLLNR